MLKSKAHSFSSINALIKGDFNPNFTCEQILKEGNFGLGTFEGLEGELIVVHGKAYQLINNTNVVLCESNTKVAFAFVCNHDYKGFGYKMNNINKDNLENKLLDIFKTKNLVQAIYAKAKVKTLHSRTVVKQEKPYKPMVEIIDSQSELTIENKEIELVGYYTPSLFAKVGVEGFHWHYISEDKTYGGHVFDMGLENISLIIKPIHDLNYHSPTTQEFLNLDLNETNYNDSIQKVEKK